MPYHSFVALGSRTTCAPRQSAVFAACPAS
eukprot:COSAG02_NODE_19872_length_860_cov_8.419185_1_plen_29_part_01